ncbi:MAG: gamma-glutamyl-gamma-aminobutyrate hydrolase family protein [Anaerolineales bacterium]|nr:gamma-glutamyl-gamma-aminobutyrate hydrolase family protein [Anaerolineales bacterium]
MTHPLIGIPCRPDVTGGIYPGRTINVQNDSYINAVIQAGGLPVLIPLQVQGELLEELFQRLDGLIFSGGGDIDPACYGETPQVDTLDEINPLRDEVEIRLMQLATERGKPFLAICRGIQVMNVANGGSLWQDIFRQKPQAIRHNYYSTDTRPRDYLAHDVTLEPGSLLSRILDADRLPVNSLHHQGVKQVGSRLRAVGHAADGLVEVLEVPNHPFGLGVQWHPEELVDSQPEARQLFAGLVSAARNGYK